MRTHHSSHPACHRQHCLSHKGTKQAAERLQTRGSTYAVACFSSHGYLASPLRLYLNRFFCLQPFLLQFLIKFKLFFLSAKNILENEIWVQLLLQKTEPLEPTQPLPSEPQPRSPTQLSFPTPSQPNPELPKRCRLSMDTLISWEVLAC